MARKHLKFARPAHIPRAILKLEQKIIDFRIKNEERRMRRSFLSLCLIVGYVQRLLKQDFAVEAVVSPRTSDGLQTSVAPAIPQVTAPFKLGG